MKRLLVAVGLIIGLVLFGGLWPYAQTVFQRTHKLVDDRIPIDYQLDVVRNQLDGLVSEVRQNVELVAREELEVEQVTRELSDREEALADARQTVLRLKQDVARNQPTYVYASNQQYSLDEVKRELAARFERYKVMEASVESRRKIKRARQASLDSARQRLQAMIDQKRKLEVDVENLEARLRVLEVAQTNSEIALDDSKLGRCKKLIDNIHAKLTVAEKVLAAESVMQGEIALDPPHVTDIVAEIDQHFATPVAVADRP